MRKAILAAVLAVLLGLWLKDDTRAGNQPPCSDEDGAPLPDCDEQGEECPGLGCAEGVTADCDDLPNGATCDDGSLCTGNDQCSDGVCAGDPLACELADGCNTGQSCDPATGQCVDNPPSDGAPCDDGDPCTTGDTCATEVCTGAPVVCPSTDELVCTIDACDEQTGQCANQAASCDDTNACTLDSCSEPDGCTHNEISCDDLNGCTEDACDPESGCLNTTVTCDDYDACTADSCDSALGCQYTLVSCDDANPCTSDSCASNSGCSYENVSNGTECNDTDACFNGSCLPLIN